MLRELQGTDAVFDLSRERWVGAGVVLGFLFQGVLEFRVKVS
jgi:hypothetical protein